MEMHCSLTSHLALGQIFVHFLCRFMLIVRPICTCMWSHYFVCLVIGLLFVVLRIFCYVVRLVRLFVGMLL
jgi:hypothetical protein